MQLRIPQAIQEIMHTLESHGYEAFYVGGCVRDAYMGREVHDYDAATNATPIEMKQALSAFRIIETGIQHGTLTILHQNHTLEITTYRTNEIYQDHRKPASIQYAKTLKEDLSRRDFTMNALAYHEAIGIIDEFGGREDIDAKLIRCIHDPKKRFEEDALRILRGIRFAHRFHFEIEEKTKKAMIQKSYLLENVSIERCRDELFAMLSDPPCYLLSQLDQIHALTRLGLSYEPQIDEQLNHSLPDLEIRLAILLSHQDASNVLHQWKCSKKMIHRVSAIQEACTRIYSSAYEIRKLLWQHNNDFDFVRKILMTAHQSTELLEQIQKKNDILESLTLNGHDLKALGYEGKIIKVILDACIEYCLEDLKHNQKDILIEYIKKTF